MRHIYFHGHHGHSAWLAVFSGITMVLFWLLAIALLILLWRVLTHRKNTPAAWQGPSVPAPGAGSPSAPSVPSAPEQLLAERLARGEIDVEEYRQRLAALRGNPDTGP